MRLSKARKEAVTAVMKNTIFEAAGSVLEKHGVGGVTMDRVATTAGLTAGSLYNYFRNKDDLMQFVYSRVVEPFFQSVERTSKLQRSAPEKLKEILHSVRDGCIEHRVLIRFWVGENHNDQRRKDDRMRFFKILVAIIERGICEGSFRPHNPANSARVLQGCLQELFELLEAASNEEVNEYIDFLIDASLGEFPLHAKKASKSAKAVPPSSNP
jgi:AcrR family transcriptional regulator